MKFFSFLRRKYATVLISFVCFAFLLARSFNFNFFGSSKRPLLFNKNCLNRKSPNFNSNFTLNPKYSVCEPESMRTLLLFVFVVIAPDKFAKRMAIRTTWANKTLFKEDLKVVFVVGISKNREINTLLEQEFNLYKDLIQIDYTDSYHTLTTKIILSFKWISKYCYNSKFVLRVNDDVVVNTFSLLKYLGRLKYQSNQLYGLVYEDAGPEREPMHKFYVSPEEHYNSKYDTYAEGMIYIILAKYQFLSRCI